MAFKNENLDFVVRVIRVREGIVKHLGSGILVSPTMVVTCVHNILSDDKFVYYTNHFKSQHTPQDCHPHVDESDEIRVEIQGKSIGVTLAGAHSPRFHPCGEDVVLLNLDAEVDVTPAQFVTVDEKSARYLEQCQFDIYGYRKGAKTMSCVEAAGKSISKEFADASKQGLLTFGLLNNVIEGYSGGPVVINRGKTPYVLGMATLGRQGVMAMVGIASDEIVKRLFVPHAISANVVPFAQLAGKLGLKSAAILQPRAIAALALIIAVLLAATVNVLLRDRLSPEVSSILANIWRLDRELQIIFEQGDHPKVLELGTTLVAIDENNHVAQHLVANSHTLLGQYPKARFHLDQLLAKYGNKNKLKQFDKLNRCVAEANSGWLFVQESVEQHGRTDGKSLKSLYSASAAFERARDFAASYESQYSELNEAFVKIRLISVAGLGSVAVVRARIRSDLAQQEKIGQCDEAIRLLTEAIDSMRDEVRSIDLKHCLVVCLLHRSEAYLLKGPHKFSNLAIDDLIEVTNTIKLLTIDDQRTSVVVHGTIGLIYQSLGEHLEAVKHLKAAEAELDHLRYSVNDPVFANISASIVGAYAYTLETLDSSLAIDKYRDAAILWHGLANNNDIVLYDCCATTLLNYGVLLAANGKEQEAVTEYLRLKQYLMELWDVENESLRDTTSLVLMNLAWRFAVGSDEVFDPDKAREFIEAAVRVGVNRDFAFLDTLGAVHAANGEFDKAVTTQKEACDACPTIHRREFEERLALYRSKKAFREV